MTSKSTHSRKPSALVARKRKRAKQEILESAQQLLDEGGIEAVTLASVSAQLDMTKQALYHYFHSKEALVRGLVTTLLDDEIETVIAAIQAVKDDSKLLSVLIKSFYAHYIDNLDAFRTIYCQIQLYAPGGSPIDQTTLRDQIHPRTRKLFDILEKRIAGESAKAAARARARQLAFSAWISALGLMTMVGIADATDDPLSHPHQALLDTLANVFDRELAAIKA